MDIPTFTPDAWFWIVGNDESRAWSSAARGYVQEWDAAKVTRVPDEAQLVAVLRHLGLSAPVVSADDVNAERDRRIFSGFSFNGVRFQSRIEDQKRIAGAGTLALAAIVGGAQSGNLRWHGGDADFAWIAEDNSLVAMDAQTVIAFGQAAAHHKSRHVFAARVLKDTDPIPADYADDVNWV